MSEFVLTVKHLSVKNYQINVNDNTTVGELKSLIEKESNLPAKEIKLIFKGRILKDDKESMKDQKINENTPISMIHQTTETQEPPRSQPASSASTVTGSSSLPQTPSNPFANMGLGGGAIPDLGSLGLGGVGMDQMQQMMNNPAVREQVSNLMQNPEMIRTLLHNHPLGQQLSQQNPQLAQMFSDPNFSSQLSGMMNMFGGSGSTPGQPVGGQSNPAAEGSYNLPPINFANLLGNLNPAAAPTPDVNPSLPPEERYRNQLSQLNDMGFVNNELNIQALTQSGGNVDIAVEKLLSWFK